MRGDTKGLEEGLILRISGTQQCFETLAQFPSGHCSNNYACMQLMFPDCFWSATSVPAWRSPVEITRSEGNTQQAGRTSAPQQVHKSCSNPCRMKNEMLIHPTPPQHLIYFCCVRNIWNSFDVFSVIIHNFLLCKVSLRRLDSQE